MSKMSAATVKISNFTQNTKRKHCNNGHYPFNQILKKIPTLISAFDRKHSHW